MPGKVFIDTNIFLYGIDEADPIKQAASRAVVNEAHRSGSGVISTQVLMEFYNGATRKLRIAPLEAKRLTLTLTEFEVVPTDVTLDEAAIDLSILHSTSLWDAMIIAAARRAECSKLLTQDMRSRPVISGVNIVDPL